MQPGGELGFGISHTALVNIKAVPHNGIGSQFLNISHDMADSPSASCLEEK